MIFLLIMFFSFSVLGADSWEPPTNSFLADSPWPMTHRNPYCQASSHLPGPNSTEVKRGVFKVRSLPEQAVAITLNFGEKNSTGHFSIWGSSLNTLYKLNANEGKWRSAQSVRKGGKSAQAISGAYTVLDKQGRLYIPRGKSVFVYDEVESGDPKSRIRKVQEHALPSSVLLKEDEVIVGLNLTYDGFLALVTNYSLVAILDRFTGVVTSLRLNPAEEVSNSLALDEEGGIYVVTHKKMYGLIWDGQTLRPDWDSEVPSFDGVLPGRLGKGSGTTPTLMGSGRGDKLVVIADGLKKMNLMAFWRKDIPRDWKAIPGYSRRVAGVYPIQFGNPKSERSITDQSLLVRGYEAVAVNNDYGERPSDNWSNFWTILYSNLKDYAPYGIEKFSWNSKKRTLESLWANPHLSVPNGIPTMSAETGLIYYMGQNEEVWTMEGVSWETGELAFRVPLRNAIKYNSYYAGMEIGYDSMLVSGTVGGALQLAR